jgi:hypothetical protein
MSYDYDRWYGEIAKMLTSGVTVREGMRQLIDLCARDYPDEAWNDTLAIEFEKDIENLAQWLHRMLTTEPPGDAVGTLWFGLFNPIWDDEEPSIVMYHAGLFSYEHGAPYSEDDAIYRPEERYAMSLALRDMYRVIARMSNESAAVIGEYVLALGYGCLAVREICQTLDPKILLGDRRSRDVAVGIDSGDSFHLGIVDITGFQIARH